VSHGNTTRKVYKLWQLPGGDLEERPVTGTVDTEREVDFRLGMGGEVIQETLLTGQLAEQSREYRSDQRGLAGTLLAHDGDQPFAQAIEVDAYLIGEGLSNSPQPPVVQSHGVSSQK
jgi:hypothetical protein